MNTAQSVNNALHPSAERLLLDRPDDQFFWFIGDFMGSLGTALTYELVPLRLACVLLGVSVGRLLPREG